MLKATVAGAKKIAARLLKEHEVTPIEKSTVREGADLLRSYENKHAKAA